MKGWLVLFALCLATPTLAQLTSELQPTPPPVPEGTTGAYFPGMPLPKVPEKPAAAGAAAASSGGAPGGTTTPDSSGRTVFNPLDGSDAPEEGTEVPAHVAAEGAAVHEVKAGDTLWSLAAAYLKNAWAWPKLWSYNPSITNPHWIYPGDTVRLAPEQAVAAPVAAESPSPPPPPAPSAPSQPVAYLPNYGYVDNDELKAAGKISGSPEGKLMLAKYDRAYVEFRSDRTAYVGQKFSIYRIMEEVRHPVTNRKLGHMVRIYGEAEVKRVDPNLLTRVEIIASNDAIEREYLVGPMKRRFNLSHPRTGTKAIDGVIVAALRPVQLLAKNYVVVIDRGRQDGVELGNRFEVLRRGDGYQPLVGNRLDGPRFPQEVIAQMQVVDVRENTAVALITDSKVEAKIGDRVSTRAGF